MREILFRGKREDNGEWVEGRLIADEAIVPKGQVFYISDNVLDSTVYACIVIPETVGQYTGLKDKNGKKIFEGDILRIAKISDGLGDYYFPSLNYPVNVLVKWDLCAWVWETLCADKMYITFPNAWWHYESEVIGNIYDNPVAPKKGR